MPQSQAYRTLSDRLVTVSSLQMHIGFSESRQNYNINKSDFNQKNNNDSSNNNNNNNNNNEINNSILSTQQDRIDLDNLYTDLLTKFQIVQERHVTFRISLITQKKINKANSGILLKLGSGTNLIADDGMDPGPTASAFVEEV